MGKGGPLRKWRSADHDMATKKPQQASSAPTEARALVDIPSLDVRCGQLLVADALTIAALVEGGEADAHPDAVAYAKANQD